MSDPYIGEIRLFGFPRAPTDWALCNGQLLSINEYEPLYTLIGTTYGGDGRTTFGVPDLRGRVPIHYGQGANLPNYAIGQRSGSETVTLLTSQLPSHSHALMSTSNTGTTATPGPTVHFATDNLAPPAGNLYAPAANATNYAVLAQSLTNEGGNGPHQNIMPTLVGNYCICLYGIYPTAG